MTDQLYREIVRLKAENDELRARFRVSAPESVDPLNDPDEPRPLRVILLPDPLSSTEPDEAPEPETVANLARTTISILSNHQPDIDWRAEHDIERIPEGVDCFQLGQVLARMMSDAKPLPMTFRVEPDFRS